MDMIRTPPNLGPMSQRIRDIRAFIVETFLFGEQPDLDADVSLLGSGTIDSTGVLELILFLEQTYGIDIADEDLVPENLDSIDRVARFVQRKLDGLKA